MSNLYISGKLVQTGTHGETSYVFDSGEPVPNTGVSDYVYESGTGVGGGLEMAWNSQAKESVGAISTAETQDTFYGYDGANDDSASHGYYVGDVGSLFFHENSDTGDVALVVTWDAPSSTGTGGQIDSSFSTGVNYDVIDGESADSFGSGGAFNTWDDGKTDGYVISGFDTNELSFSNVADLTDFRYYTGSDWNYYGGVPDRLRVTMK